MRPQAFAEVFYSVFVKRSSFKSLLNFRKAYIFQEFAEGPLLICVGWIFQNVHLSKVFKSKSTELCSSAAVVPQNKSTELCSLAAVAPQSKSTEMSVRCEVRQRRFIMTCDIFGTGQMNILGLCYLFGKAYKQPTVATLKSLKLTHSTKLLHLLRRTIRYH